MRESGNEWHAQSLNSSYLGEGTFGTYSRTNRYYYRVFTAIEIHDFTGRAHILPWLNHGCANHLALIMVPFPFHDIANELSALGWI